jgi:hypothetical protein
MRTIDEQHVRVDAVIARSEWPSGAATTGRRPLSSKERFSSSPGTN